MLTRPKPVATIALGSADLQAPVACNNIHTAGGRKNGCVQYQAVATGLKFDIGNYHLIAATVCGGSCGFFTQNMQPFHIPKRQLPPLCRLCLAAPVAIVAQPVFGDKPCAF